MDAGGNLAINPSPAILVNWKQKSAENEKIVIFST